MPKIVAAGLTCVSLFLGAALCFAQGVPQPARIAGTVTVGGVQLTQATDDGYVFEVTQPDGSPFKDVVDSPAKDTDGLSSVDWYLIDIPIYEKDTQPEGATPGQTAVIHVYQNGDELTLTSPLNGEITVGDSGTAEQIDLEAEANEPQPPVADAGVDQTVDEGVQVTLDGSNSNDPDDDIASYAWEQTAGPDVTLSDSSIPKPTFTSPNVGPDGVALTFKLTVTDESSLSDSDTVTVNVTWVNIPPTADAGPDQNVSEGEQVSLDGSGSEDMDDGIASYAWTQTAGPDVTLSDASAVQPTFTSPDVGPDGATLTFKLTVQDEGGLQSSDSVNINVTWVNVPPTADAGSDQTVTEGTTVTLDGTASEDVDDGIASYSWQQTSGPDVTLADSGAGQTTFVLPALTTETVFGFELTVADTKGLVATDQVAITAQDNGITDFPDDVLSFETYDGSAVLGLAGDANVSFLFLEAMDPADATKTNNKPTDILYGLVTMHIKVASAGDSAEVTVYFQDALPEEYTCFKYNDTDGWLDFSDQVSFNDDRTQMVMTLVDGGAGDGDDTANAVIEDPFALGQPQEGGGGGGGGCLMDPHAQGGWEWLFIGLSLLFLRFFRRSCRS